MLNTNTIIKIKATKEIENEIRDDCHYIICTDGDCYDYLQNDNVLVLSGFSDTEMESRDDSFSVHHAEAVKSFLETNKIRILYITCVEGQSRSVGLAAAILFCTGDDDWIWKGCNKYQPNILVYRRTLEMLCPDDSRDQIELIDEFLSPRGYARFRSLNLDNGNAGYDVLLEPKREEGQTIQYGLLYGSCRNLVIFIKAGRDSVLDKENNKYLKVAADLVSNHSVSVIVATTPHDRTYQFSCDADFLNDYFESEGIAPQDRKVLYLGHSDGAASAVVCRSSEMKTDEMFKAYVLSGLPLYQNYQDFGIVLEKLKEINKHRLMKLVYGEHDKSYERFGPQLSWLAPEIDIHVVAGEDHNYSNNKKVIHSIPELFFEDNAFEDNGIRVINS